MKLLQLYRLTLFSSILSFIYFRKAISEGKIIARIIDDGLTFDDVLLVPRKSSVSSRKDVDTSTKLTNKIALRIPIVSANMDTVTESKMAIAIAREGGIGIIHRFLSVGKQAEEILKVKRSEGLMIEQPYRINAKSRVADAKSTMQEKGVSGLLVVNDEKLVGILTKRDVAFNNNDSLSVSEIMTPRGELVVAKKGVSLEEAKEILYDNRVEKLPVVDEAGDIVGLITSSDIMKKENFPYATKDRKGRMVVGAAIGVKQNDLERAEALLAAGADVIVVDIAHGHSDLEMNMIKNLRDAYGDNVEIIGGNVATTEGCEDLINAGVDSVKIGVGPGATCTTRIITGSGVPQLTAVMECAKIAKEYGTPLIADGGMRTSGDITKALAAGAHTVMLGTLFAGTDESPGTTLIKDGVKYKICRGMASYTANADRKQMEGSGLDFSDFTPEGVEAFVPYKGSVVDVLKQLVNGLRSGMSYCGAHNIEEMHKNATFIKISEASVRESRPHDVKLI